MINEARLRDTFLELVGMNSPPGQEREVARRCAEMLRDAGFVCQTDTAGNVIAQKAGTIPSAPRIFFSAHTDTVQPTAGLIVRDEDGMFRTGGTTILGADDKAGLAEILEGVRVLEERTIPHGDLLVVFSTGEEVGLLGAQALATEVIAGSIGFVLDASGRTGAIITAAPTHETLRARFTGKAAHAGFQPEKGISAIQVAARAIDRMPLGRIDPETTANIGTIQGGKANNIVAEECVMRMEARSRDPEKLAAQVRRMREALEEAAAHYGAEVEIEHAREYQGYSWTEDDLPIRLARDGWSRVSAAGGRAPEVRPTGGGSDANIFNARAVPSVVLSCGYVDAHTFNERVAIQDMIEAAEWVVRIAEAAAAA